MYKKNCDENKNYDINENDQVWCIYFDTQRRRKIVTIDIMKKK